MVLLVRKAQKKDSKKLKLETQLAASMLYYDLEEFNKFMKLWVSVENDPDYETSGLFDTFVNHMRMIMVEENKDRLSKEFVLSKIRKYNLMEPNSQKAEKYESWLDDISSDDDPENFHLGDELFYRYAWETFKESIQKIDKSDISFREKLLVEPVRVDYTEAENIFLKASDPLERKSRTEDITTGYFALDKYVKPDYSNLMVIAARPSVGKSTLMLRMAMENAKRGIKSLFISLEMTQGQIYSKLYSWYKGRKVHEDEYDTIKLEEGFKRIDENIDFLINHSSNGEALLSIMRTHIKKHKSKIIFLDYLQLVRFTGADEWGSIRKGTYEFKTLANNEKILFVTCSQVSRESESYGVDLGSLYGGSTIEADADIVVSIERTDREMIESETKKGDVSVLKNRDGESHIKLSTIMNYVTIDFIKVGA